MTNKLSYLILISFIALAVSVVGNIVYERPYRIGDCLVGKKGMDSVFYYKIHTIIENKYLAEFCFVKGFKDCVSEIEFNYEIYGKRFRKARCPKHKQRPL